MNSPPLFPAAAGSTGPVLALLSPADGAINVSRATPIRVCVFAPAGVSVAGITFTVDGQTPAPGAAGPETPFAGRTVYQIALPPTTPAGALIRVNAEITDTLARTASAAWSYTLLPEAGVYAGNDILPAEALLLTPMQIYLELEPVRQALLANAVRDTAGTLSNRNALAARVLYQTAFSSDISSTLNPFIRPNAQALASGIPTRRPLLELADVVDSYKKRIDAGLAQIFESGAYPKEFRNNFADYLGSLLYTQRVAAAAALVLLGRALEVVATTPVPSLQTTDMDILAANLAASLGGDP